MFTDTIKDILSEISYLQFKLALYPKGSNMHLKTQERIEKLTEIAYKCAHYDDINI